MATLPYAQLMAQARSTPTPFARAGRVGLATAAAPQTQEEQEDQPFFSLGDTLMAPVRGLEGAAAGVWGLADALTGDALPDYPDRIFGESRSTVGGFVEGVTQFAAGFIPGFGALGKAGSVLGLAGKGGKIAALAKAATAGAIADFAVFDGHEARLSNLIEQFPHLQNPVTAYLAASEDDTELEGRFKNMVEGAGLGLLTDAFIQGVKALKVSRVARAKPGATAESVAEEVAAATDTDALRASLSAVNNEGSSVAEAAARGQNLEEARAFDSHAMAVEADLAENPPPETATAAVNDLGLDDDFLERVLAEEERLIELDLGEEGTSPRKMTLSERLREQLSTADLRLDKFSGPAGSQRFLRAVDTLAGGTLEGEWAALDPTTLEKRLADTAEAVGNMLGGADSVTVLQTVLADARSSAAQFGSRLEMVRLLLPSVGKWAREAVEIHRDPLRRSNLTRSVAAERLIYLADLRTTLKGLSAEASRNLSSMRLSIDPKAKIIDQLTELERLDLERRAGQMIDDLGGDKNLDKWIEKVGTLLDVENPEEGLTAFGNAIGNGWGRSAMNMTTEWWINSLLGGMRTFTTNIVGPMMASMYVPMERVIGGVLTGEKEAIQSGMAQALGLFRQSSEVFKFGLEAFNKRRGILLPQASFADPVGRGGTAAAAIEEAVAAGQRTPGSFHPLTRGIDPDSFSGRIGKFLDAIVPLPSALIAAGDEVVKQLNFRAVAQDELMRDALRQGLDPEQAIAYVDDTMKKVITDGEAWSITRLKKQGLAEADARGLVGLERTKYAEDFMQRNWDEDGQHLAPIVAKAKQRAEEVTFQQALEKGTFGRSMQDLVMQQPVLRLLAIPFVKTPTNILKFAGQRVDLPGAARALMATKFGNEAAVLANTRNRFIKDALSADPLKRADAIGRVTTGVGLMGSFIGLAAAGKITGRGPTDPERRGVLEQAGWKPYSIKFGDTYVEYRRLDPWATMVAFAADLFDYANWADPEDQSEVEQVMMAGVTSSLNVLTQASYLTGIRNFFSAVSDPLNSGSRFIQSFASSFAVPQAVAQFTVPAGDENFREARSMLDAVMRRVPGISDQLEPRRNVFGEPIRSTRRLGQDAVGSVMNVWMPLAYSEVSDDVVDRELALLKHGFAPPRPRKGGVNLLDFRSPTGQTAFDRWGQLQGEIKLNGRTIREELRQLVTSRKYQALPSETLGSIRNPRVALVSSVIDRYRDAAFNRVLREYPELNGRWRALGGNKAQAFAREVARDRSRRAQLGALGSFTSALTNPDSGRLQDQLTR